MWEFWTNRHLRKSSVVHFLIKSPPPLLGTLLLSVYEQCCWQRIQLCRRIFWSEPHPCIYHGCRRYCSNSCIRTNPYNNLWGTTHILSSNLWPFRMGRNGLGHPYLVYAIRHCRRALICLWISPFICLVIRLLSCFLQKKKDVVVVSWFRCMYVYLACFGVHTVFAFACFISHIRLTQHLLSPSPFSYPLYSRLSCNCSATYVHMYARILFPPLLFPFPLLLCLMTFIYLRTLTV